MLIYFKFRFNAFSSDLQLVEEEEVTATPPFLMSWMEGEVDLYRMKCSIDDDLPESLHVDDELIVSHVITINYDGCFKPEVSNIIA